MKFKTNTPKERLKVYKKLLSQYKNDETLYAGFCSNIRELNNGRHPSIFLHNCPELMKQQPKTWWCAYWFDPLDDSRRIIALQRAIKLTEKAINKNNK